MRHIGRYDIDDPAKIQGRDEVYPTDRSVAAIRLNHCLDAIEDASGSVLLPGCGAGRYVRAIRRARPDLHLVGGDLSTAALREARDVDIHGDYVAFDASRIPFQADTYNAVVFFDLLEHVPQYEGMLADIRRVLNPGGVLHFYVPLEDQPMSLYRLLSGSNRLPLRQWKQDHVGHINFFRGEDVLRAVWNAGFAVDDVKYGFHPFGQIHDLIDYWQRERQSGGGGILPVSAVPVIARGAFMFTWRLSYLEDRLYSGEILGSGIHVTAIAADSPTRVDRL